jgi:hypothetical protein
LPVGRSSVNITSVIKTRVIETSVQVDAMQARHLLAADAVFELVLAALLITAPVALDRVVSLPLPMWVIVACGVVLLPVAWILMRLARLPRPPRRTLRLIAAANLVTAVVLVLWLLLEDDFDASAAAFVLGVTVVLVVLAVGEASSDVGDGSLGPRLGARPQHEPGETGERRDAAG